MKMIILISSFLLMFNLDSRVNTSKVKITSNSQLVIKGSSNVNSFACIYKQNLKNDEFLVNYVKESSKIHFQGAKMVLKSDCFDCRHKTINKDFKELLKSDVFPNIQISLKEITETKQYVLAKVQIEIAGVTKDYVFPVSVIENESKVRGTARLSIKDFNLTPPKKLFGMIMVNDLVEIDFNLHLNYE